MKKYQLIGLGLSTIALAACGGGGGGGGDTGGNGGGGGNQTTTYTVSTNVTGGGSLSPASQSVDSGSTATLTVNADENNELGSISGCGGSMTGDTTYTTGTITTNCTVSATFDSLTFTVNTNINEGATINPASAELLPGEQAEFLLSADEWYSIEDISGCPVADTIDEGDNNFTIITEALEEACDLNITMALPGEETTFEVTTTTNNDGGYFDPESAVVSFDNQAEFTLVINENYRLVSVEGCSGELVGDVFTTAPIRGNCSIAAEFESTAGVYFEDDILASAVREKLGIADGEAIDAEALAQITELEVRNMGVTSLVGLEQATGLRTLDVSNNEELISIEPLFGLQLTRLIVSFTSVQSIGALQNMPLRHLDVWDTDIESIDVVSTLSELEYLDMDQTLVTSLEPVRGLQQLSDLYLNGTLVRDIRPVLDTGMGSGSELQVLRACVSPEHRISKSVLEDLQARGVRTQTSQYQLNDNCDMYQPEADVQVTSAFEGNDVVINWDIVSGATAEGLLCEIHFELDSQQPRLPKHVVENCNLQGEYRFPAERSYYQAHVIVDDGLGLRAQGDGSRMTADIDLSQPHFGTMDWGQVMLKTNPLLVPGRAAMFRTHILGSASTAPPDVFIEAHLNGNSTTIDMNKPESLQTGKAHSSLRWSYHGEIGNQWMQDGLEVRVFMSGEHVYTETPTFAEENTLYITVVPMIVDGVSPEIPSDGELRDILRNHWAYNNIEIRRRSAYTVQNTSNIESASDLLHQLADLRASEGGTSHYHGFFNFEEVGGGSAGVAFVGGTSGVTWDRDDGGDTFSHEMGHNFVLRHVDCGQPSGPDLSYPYSANSTGSVGVVLTNDELLAPDDFRDVMSYCSPQHTSDFSYEKAQDFMLANPSQPFASSSSADIAARTVSSAVRISGLIDPVNGSRINSIQPHVERADPAGSSPYVLEATDRNGELHVQKVAIHPDSRYQSGNAGYFTSVVPATELTHIRITRNNVVVLEQDL